MGLIYVTVTIRNELASRHEYTASFLVSTGAIDCIAPTDELMKIGIRPIGKAVYELADGQKREFKYGLAVIEFMGDVTAGRILFAPHGTEPVLGVTALESVGILVDPVQKTLKRLPCLPLR
ncbi:MAG: clan AA aspartic protease [Chitinivibrionales bacterium]|nr:clan AA aspartic protease [Chitinivibrionales bacterium]